MLSGKNLVSCFLRSYFVGAAFNLRGLQNLGLLFALEPGLAQLYRENKEDLLEARHSYMWHFNTHPLWAPLLIGMFLNLEQHIKRKNMPAEGLVTLKNTACYTLSAIGDSLFSGSLIPFWGLGLCCLLASGLFWLAAAWAFAWVLLFQIFRLVTFVAGLRYGLGVISRLRDMDIIVWSDRLKILNGCALALFVFLIFPLPAAGMYVFTVMLGFGACAWLVLWRNAPRLLAAALLFFILNGSALLNHFWP